MLKKLTLIILAGCMALMIASCGASDTTSRARESMANTAQQNVVVDETQDMIASSAPMVLSSERGAPAEQSVVNNAKGNSGTSGAIAANISNRKVITSASFNVQTKDYDWTSIALEAKIAETKSYVENSYTQGDKANGNATISMTIRVPSDNYNDFKTSISTLGNVTSSSENGNDVTADYFDTEARLTVLLAQEKRILVLLEKANIEEIIKIEERLSQIRTEIEQLTTVVKRYDDLVSYATVTINIQQTTDYIVNTVNESFFSKLGKAFNGSIIQAGKVVQECVLAIVWMLPYLLVIGIIVIACLYAYKKRKKKMQKVINTPVNTITPQSEKNSDETTHTF